MFEPENIAYFVSLHIARITGYPAPYEARGDAYVIHARPFGFVSVHPFQPVTTLMESVEGGTLRGVRIPQYRCPSHPIGNAFLRSCAQSAEASRIGPRATWIVTQNDLKSLMMVSLARLRAARSSPICNGVTMAPINGGRAYLMPSDLLTAVERLTLDGLKSQLKD